MKNKWGLHSHFYRWQIKQMGVLLFKDFYKAMRNLPVFWGICWHSCHAKARFWVVGQLFPKIWGDNFSGLWICQELWCSLIPLWSSSLHTFNNPWQAIDIFKVLRALTGLNSPSQAPWDLPPLPIARELHPGPSAPAQVGQLGKSQRWLSSCFWLNTITGIKRPTIQYGWP